MSVEARLGALGLELPQPPTPIGNYRPAKRMGDLVMTSGQTARINGVRRYVGKVGAEVSEEHAYLSARDSALNCLACIKWLIGDLDRVVEVVKVVGFVNCTPDFANQPAAINGASDLFAKLYGDNGAHARSAVGVNALPGNASIELEVMVRVG
jgi:enamine deaminase RidA (YjgF/YER057c/UK114 family)